jgi:dinuclear metal center YbgI/SA1388 family protein
MIKTQKLIEYLNSELEPEKFADYCFNGLQVEGVENVSKIVTGVTACQDLLDAAVACNADTVLVHHGYFWKNENPCVVDIKRNRLTTLLTNNINLIAYHLPLDAHLKYGNNIQLAKVLNFKVGKKTNIQDLVFNGKLKKALSPNDFIQHITECLKRKPLHVPGTSNMIESIAWCTGGAQDFIEQTSHLKIDAYLTGEISERIFHYARERGIHFFAAGHHATERYGIKALGEHLAKKFNLDVQFIDIDNPV